ncbi:MAG: type II toxin-antitoxin system RelE/ParE family toxin [Candidatus Woesearchaeota archaeon]
MFEVFLSSSSENFLKKCENEIHERVLKKIKELANEPFPSEAKRVVGRKEKVFRVRVEDFRILYVVFHEKSEILIADIDKRSRIY